MKFSELFDRWIKIIIEEGYPGKDIVAYNFGIFESLAEAGYKMYLIGSDYYDQDSEDWCAGTGDLLPKMVYLDLPAKEFKGLDWQEVEKIIIDKVKEFTDTEIYKKSFFNQAQAITVGFDDGDLIRIK